MNNFPKTKNELQKSIQLFQTYKYKLDEKNETDEKKLKDMHNKKINELKQQLEKLRTLFYEDFVTDVWNVEDWTTKIV